MLGSTAFQNRDLGVLELEISKMLTCIAAMPSVDTERHVGGFNRDIVADLENIRIMLVSK